MDGCYEFTAVRKKEGLIYRWIGPFLIPSGSLAIGEQVILITFYYSEGVYGLDCKDW